MIRTERLNFSIGEFALRDVTLEVREGEYFVLLGKPGSGKTLFLECLAGLKRISNGTITIGGRRVERAEPRDRGIGYVPQDYALFAAHNVRKNIEFGLRVRRYPPSRRRERARQLAVMLGIENLLGRSTEGLSGGERQRVALARALSAEPGILLLDEPVSALDDETREGILVELRRIQRQTKTTTIHVCHDLSEMRCVADRVGILRDGRLIQVGSPDEVSRRPAEPHVARLFRLGTVLTGTARKRQSGSEVESGGLTLRSEQPAEGEVEFLVRAADVRLDFSPSQQAEIAAQVESVLWNDSAVRVDLRAGSTSFRAEVPHAQAEALSLSEGMALFVAVPPQAVYVFQKPESEA
jgi:ABC-type sugar transport system ATPase subunit